MTGSDTRNTLLTTLLTTCNLYISTITTHQENHQ
jgi:hypothetical protein